MRKYLRSLYDCAQICGLDRDHDGDPTSRAACRCSLPGFDPTRWDPAANPDAAAEVEALAVALQGHAASAGIPLDFDLDRDGCPRGWADSHFGATVMLYAGTRHDVDSPMRTQNLRLLGRVMRDPEPPTRLLDMVEWGTGCEDACFAYYQEVKAR